MSILNFLFPEKCFICGHILKKGEHGACEACFKNLPIVTEPLCKHCGKPIEKVEQMLCGDCEGRISRVTQGTAVWLYDEQMQKAMADYKYGGCLDDGDFFAKEMLYHRLELLQSWQIDAVIPVPLHWRKLWFRGFNQAAYLAEQIGEVLGVPVWEHALVRKRYTAPQKGLGNKERAKNLKHAIGMNEEYQSRVSSCKHILLIDDIYTTGATVEACARELSQYGVKNTYFACLCIGRDY